LKALVVWSQTTQLAHAALGFKINTCNPWL